MTNSIAITNKLALAVAVTSLFLAFLASPTAYAQVRTRPNRPTGVPDRYAITPSGYFDPSCVRQLAKGETLREDGHVMQHADGTLENIPACNYPRYMANGEIVVAGSATVEPPSINQWVEDAYTTTTTSYAYVAATWTVPPAPTSNDGQRVYFFPGLEDNEDVVSILQPVLGWNMDYSNISTWSIASWNCCASGNIWYSPFVAVNPGDTIQGFVASTCSVGTLSCPTWNITAYDESSRTSTTLENAPNDGQTFNWGFAGVLEVYNVSQCSDYPPNGLLSFSNVALYDYNFNLISTPNWSFYTYPGLTPQCNYGGQVAPTQVSVDYGTIPPTVTGFNIAPTTTTVGTTLSATVIGEAGSNPLSSASLLRTTDLSGATGWTTVASVSVTGSSVNVTLYDTPLVGTYLYGAHITDNTGLFGTEPSTIQVTVNPVIPTTITAFSATPLTVSGGGTVTYSVTLSGAAPTGGALISFNSSATTVIPYTTVSIPGGATTGQTTVVTQNPASTSQVTITASYGSSSKQQTITVNPVVQTITAFNATPSTVNGGATVTYSVTLSGAAPTGGALISLNSSATSVIPNTSVSLLGGTTSGQTTVVTQNPGSTTQVTVTASYGSSSKQQTITVNPVAAYSIAGYVTLNGSGLAGVTMTLSGGAQGSIGTNSSGYYSFSGLVGGANYTIVPSLSGYTFSPPSEGFTGLNANQTANFVASVINGTYAISGQVTLNGSGLAGVTMTLSEGQSSSTTTNSSGNYSFGGLTGGVNYLVVPSLAGYSFSPGGAGFDPLNSNQTANFAASLTPPSGPVLAFTPGIISTAAGNGTAGYAGDGGTAASAELYSPSGAAVDATGNVYIADFWNNVVRKVSTTTGTISTVAGNGYGAGLGYGGYSGDGGSATSAELYHPNDVAVDLAGNLYIADSQNSRIRVVNMQSNAITIVGVTIQPGYIATVAGNGTQGYSGNNGPATAAELFEPNSVAVDYAGNVFIADTENSVIRMVSAGLPSPFVPYTPTNGYIYTVAGNGTPGSSGNGGLANSAELRGPSGVSVDTMGNLYIADTSNSSVRVVSALTNANRTQDYIYNVAGIGFPGYSGDGGPATSAELNWPEGLATDGAGNVYIADSNNNRIREVNTATGIITTVAGDGIEGYSGDNGSAKSAELNDPYGVAVSPSTGIYYVADPGNERLREVNIQLTALVFPQTNVGQVSTAQDVTVSNVGAQSLSITQISTSAGFNLNGADTTCSSGTTLAPGASCILGIEFAPLQSGPATGSVTLTDNAANSPQTVSLSGTGALGTPTVSWNPSTTSIAYGTAISAGVLDATATIYGNPVAGTFAYTDTPSGGSSQTVSVGTILPVGIYTLSVLFTPNNTAAYTTATASISLTVNQAPLSLQLSSSSTSITVGQTVTFTTILSGVTGGAGPTGSVTFYDGSAALGSGTISLVSGQYQATFSTNSLAVGTHNITAQYPGDTNYSGGTSNVVTVTVNSNTTPLTVSPTSLSFGNQGIDSTSAAKNVTVTNNTGAVVTIYSTVISGPNSGDFSESATTCGSTLGLKKSCTISIAFTPAASGARSATLTLTDSAVNSPQTVALSGTGVLQVTLSAATFAFGNQADGTTSVAKTVTLTNNTSSALTISSVALTGTNASEFTVSSNTCGSSVGGRSSCKIGVTFDPVTAGAKTAALTITDTANNSPQSVKLTGTGVVPVAVTPSSLTFAAQTVGTTSVAKTVTIKNNLPTTLTLSGDTFSGTNAGDYAQSATTCGSILAASTSCTVSIEFKPTAKGTRLATMDIADSAITSPQTVSLSGMGK